jgi:hypothetical protein
MSANKIGESSLFSMGGCIYQGGEFADWDDIPNPRAVVSMVGSLFHMGLNLSIYINDTPKSCLPDNELLALVDATCGFLKNGINVFIHCLQGKSRSSYLNCAIHMKMMKMSYDSSLAFIKRYHPVAQPNTGFEAHLNRMKAEKLL